MEGRQAKTPLDLLSKDLSAPKPMKQSQGHPSQPLIYDEFWIPMNPFWELNLNTFIIHVYKHCTTTQQI